MYSKIMRQGNKTAKQKKNKEKKQKYKNSKHARQVEENNKIKETKKQEFITFIIKHTLTEDDYDYDYDYDSIYYRIKSAWELAIHFGPSFNWVIMEYDNFTMPNPDVLNRDLFAQTYHYMISELPSLDYILNLALRNGCNNLIIEKLLKSGANPNRTPFDYITANMKIIKKEKKSADAQKQYEKFSAEVCRDICFTQTDDNTECTGKCRYIIQEQYNDGYDDYDVYDDDYDDDVTELPFDHQLISPLCIAAASGMIETIKILIKYKADIKEYMLEYNSKTKYKLTKFNVLNYVNRSLNDECIEFIKSEFQKIQSDAQSLRQCTMSAILNKRSSNCLYIPNIYNHVKSFLGCMPHLLRSYIPIIRRYRNTSPIYTKSGLHIYNSDIKSGTWTLTRLPQYEIVKSQENYQYNEFVDYSFNTYQPVLPHIYNQKLGLITIPKDEHVSLNVCIDINYVSISINKKQDLYNFRHDNQDYVHYSKYVMFLYFRNTIIISCTFTGKTQSERISNMVKHYLSYDYIINTDIFGTYT